jgi:tRNA threonylcarbamoyl adenosine modification protein (Sua5/YciO/YrdC/YwlC family)
MTERIQIHPVNPQPRLVAQAVDIIARGGLVVYPTDSCYALACSLGNADAVARIRRIRQTDRRHFFSLVCRDLSEIATYAKIDNQAYRLLKSLTPGPYTFVLQATREVPKRLLEERRRTLGIRVPDNVIAHAILQAHDEPLTSSTLQLPGDEYALNDPDEIEERIGKRVDLLIDGGPCGLEPTTVVDLTGGMPVVLREGAGDISPFG